MAGIFLLSNGALSQTKTIDQSNTRDGESVEYCLQHKKMADLIESDPAVAQTLANDELIRQQELASSQAVQTKATTFYVPIVFHILHNGGSENVSDEQVLDAVEIMNRDYARMNADADAVHPDFQGMPAASDIVFVLATKAPNGTCFSGITRTQNNLTNDGSDGQAQVTAIINGNDVYQGAWPGDEYLNVFVCAEIGGAAGYTYTPNNWLGGSMYNGIWILDTYLGSIGTSSPSSSRTMTHEAGHWLNLSHVWGPNNNPGNAASCSDDDGVTDTPNEIGVTSCNLNEATCGPRANVENYMDYSYCSKMFTQGQVTRMRNALSSGIGGRNNLKTAANLIATGADGNTYLCKAEFSADRTSICPGNTIQFSDESYNTVNGWTWSFEGGTPATSSDQNPVITYNTPGLYEVTLTATDGSSNDGETKTNFIRVLPDAAALPFSEGFESFSSLTNIEEWSIINNGGVGFEIEANSGENSSKSARLRNFGEALGTKDELISAPVDLSSITDQMTLTFKYAHKRRNSTDDDWMKVYASTDCGETWALRKSLHGPFLSSEIQSSSFTPNSIADWKTVHITNILSTFWVNNFRYKFEFEAGGGNNFYIDNINLYQGAPINLGLNENSSTLNDVVLYPNPANEEINVSFSVVSPENALIEIQDVTGKVSQAHNILAAEGSNLVMMDTSKLASGIYFMKINVGGNQQTVQFIVK